MHRDRKWVISHTCCTMWSLIIIFYASSTGFRPLCSVQLWLHRTQSNLTSEHKMSLTWHIWTLFLDFLGCIWTLANRFCRLLGKVWHPSLPLAVKNDSFPGWWSASITSSWKLDGLEAGRETFAFKSAFKSSTSRIFRSKTSLLIRRSCKKFWIHFHLFHLLRFSRALRQYKNDSTEPKNLLVLKLPRFSPLYRRVKSAAISKLDDPLVPSTFCRGLLNLSYLLKIEIRTYVYFERSNYCRVIHFFENSIVLKSTKLVIRIMSTDAEFSTYQFAIQYWEALL